MYYVIIGRIPGDDEDTVYTCRAANRSEAESLFEAEMHANVTLDELDAITRANGMNLYINWVLASETPIATLSTNP